MQRTTLGFFQSIHYQLLERMPDAMSSLTKAFLEKKNGKHRSEAYEDFHGQTSNDMSELTTYRIQTEPDWLKTELQDILSISLRECVKRRSI